VRKAMLAHSESREITGELITSPWDLFSVETLRDKHGLRKGASVPTDVFTFGFGEPNDLSATKVGGKAAFPRSMKWPNSKTGQTLRFLGQLNFGSTAVSQTHIAASAAGTNGLGFDSHNLDEGVVLFGC